MGGIVKGIGKLVTGAVKGVANFVKKNWKILAVAAVAAFAGWAVMTYAGAAGAGAAGGVTGSSIGAGGVGIGGMAGQGAGAGALATAAGTAPSVAGTAAGAASGPMAATGGKAVGAGKVATSGLAGTAQGATGAIQGTALPATPATPAQIGTSPGWAPTATPPVSTYTPAGGAPVSTPSAPTSMASRIGAGDGGMSQYYASGQAQVQAGKVTTNTMQSIEVAQAGEQAAVQTAGTTQQGYTSTIAEKTGGVMTPQSTAAANKTLPANATRMSRLTDIFKKTGRWMEDNPIQTMMIGQGISGTIQGIREAQAREEARRAEADKTIWGVDRSGKNWWYPDTPQTSEPVQMEPMDPNAGKTEISDQGYKMRSGVLENIRRFG